jgi:hypothetical protein
MKTAFMLIPNTTDVDRTEYLQFCIEKVMEDGYMPFSPMIYESYAVIDFNEFVKQMLPMSDVVYMFVDHGIDQQMFDVIDRAVASNIELKYCGVGKLKFYEAHKTPFQILTEVCRKTGYSIQELTDKTRKREIVDARFVYFRRAKEKTSASLAAIGAQVNKDHATVLHGIREAFEKLEVVNLYKKVYGKAEIKTSSLGENEECGADKSSNLQPIQRPVLPYRSMDPRESGIPAAKFALRSVPKGEYYSAFGGYGPQNTEKHMYRSVGSR